MSSAQLARRVRRVEASVRFRDRQSLWSRMDYLISRVDDATIESTLDAMGCHSGEGEAIEKALSPAAIETLLRLGREALSEKDRAALNAVSPPGAGPIDWQKMLQALEEGAESGGLSASRPQTRVRKALAHEVGRLLFFEFGRPGPPDVDQTRFDARPQGAR